MSSRKAVGFGSEGAEEKEVKRFNIDASEAGLADKKEAETQARAEAFKRRAGQSRGTISSRADHEELMDKILFEDDAKGGEILKGLISSHGLRTWSEKLLKRMKHLEEVTGARKERSAMSKEELERAFATRKECRQLVVEEYEGRFSAQERRLDALEAAASAAQRRFEQKEKDASGIDNKLAALRQTIEVTQKDILRVEQQDRDHHGAAVELNQQLRVEMGEQQAAASDAREALSVRITAESQNKQGLIDSLQELKDFLYSAGLQKQLQVICTDMLKQYVSWDDMATERTGIHSKAVDAATQPLQKDIKALKGVVDVNYANLTMKDSALNNDLLALVEKVNVTDRKFHDRIDDVVAQVSQRAMDTRLSDVEKRLIARDEYHEIDFTEFKELQTKKIEESYDRIQELESSIFAHEHALEHWAEEIGNRATKYDMMVQSSRVEKCALKEKYDADYKEVQKTLKWQSVKLENLTFKSNFGGSSEQDGASPSGSIVSQGPKKVRVAKKAVQHESRPSDGADDDGLFVRSDSKGSHEDSKDCGEDADGAGQATGTGEPTKVHAVSHPAASGNVHAEQPTGPPAVQRPAFVQQPTYHAESEMVAMLHAQVESLTHCVLVLSNAALRQAMCGLSREAKMEREDRLIFHIKSLLYWIMHRAAPPDWDPLELTSLAQSVEDKHKRRAVQAHMFHSNHKDDADSPHGRDHSDRAARRVLRSATMTLRSATLPPDAAALVAQDVHSLRPTTCGANFASSAFQTEHGANFASEAEQGAPQAEHFPEHSSTHAEERAQHDRERAERRQKQWVEQGGSYGKLSCLTKALEENASQNSLAGSSSLKKESAGSSAHPKRAAKKHATGPLPPAAEAEAAAPEARMRELVMEIFGDQDQPPSYSSHGSRHGKLSPLPVAGSLASFRGSTPDSEGRDAATSDVVALPRLAHGGSASAR